MLYQFLKDMWDILRLRFHAPEHYRYTLPVVAAVLLLLGIINAASMSSLFGREPAAIAFAVLLTTVKWLMLARAMRAVIGYYGGGAKLPLWGYTLASETLAVPLMLLLYAPQLGTLGIVWQVWTFFAQATGFMRIGNISAGKVLLGYFLYLVGTLAVGTVLLMLFVTAGWFDADVLNQQMKVIMENRS